MQAGGKYFVFYSNKGETALADHFGAKFVDAVAGDICRTEAFTPEALAAVAAGADGLLVEVHDRPATALSDGAQSLTPAAFAQLAQKVRCLREALQ